MINRSLLARAVVSAILVVCAPAAFGSRIYFVEFDSDGPPGTMYHYSLNRANLDGSGREEVVDDMVGQPDYASLVVDGGVVYWNLVGGGTYAATTDGTLLGPVSAPSLRVGAALNDDVLDVAGAHVYTAGRDEFGARQNVLRADPDYDDWDTLVETRRFSPNLSVALDETRGKIYWAGSWSGGVTGLLQRANLADGSEVETLLEGFAQDDYTIDLAIDPGGGKLYWANSSRGVIQRANMDGTGLEDLLTGVWASSVALDLVPVPEPSIAGVCMAAGVLLLRHRATVRRGRFHFPR